MCLGTLSLHLNPKVKFKLNILRIVSKWKKNSRFRLPVNASKSSRCSVEKKKQITTSFHLRSRNYNNQNKAHTKIPFIGWEEGQINPPKNRFRVKLLILRVNPSSRRLKLWRKINFTNKCNRKHMHQENLSFCPNLSARSKSQNSSC